MEPQRPVGQAVGERLERRAVRPARRHTAVAALVDVDDRQTPTGEAEPGHVHEQVAHGHRTVWPHQSRRPFLALLAHLQIAPLRDEAVHRSVNWKAPCSYSESNATPVIGLLIE